MPTVTFINIPARIDIVLSLYPPVGILSMAACLRESGFSATFIDADLLHLDPEAVAQRVAQDPPRLVGISLTVGQVAHAQRYIAAIQQSNPGIQIVVGGPYVSGVGESIFCDFPSIQFAVVKEGEHAIVGLAQHLAGTMDLAAVRNLLYRKGDAVCVNASERILDIDNLPPPDYSLVKDIFEDYPAPSPSIASPSMIIMCTRGCPYECTFCSSPASWDRRVTFRSTDSVIREIVHLKDTFNAHEVFFQDDTLNARPAWFAELCDKIIERGLNKGIYYKCAFRANEMLLTPELLNKAKAANFWMIFYGVENGNQEMLRSMKKNVTVDEIRRAFRLTRDAGIYSYASLMIGNAGETRATVQDSLRLLDDVRPDFGGFAIAVPFPGSEFYRDALARGHITQLDFKKYAFGDCIVRTDELRPSDIVELVGTANAHLGKIQNEARKQLPLKTRKLSATIALQRVPAEMHASQCSALGIVVANKSEERFCSAPPNPVHLAYHWRTASRKCTVFDGRRTSFAVPLLPGDERPVKIEIEAPTQPGKYLLELTLVQEGCFWFERHVKGLPLRLPITVTA